MATKADASRPSSAATRPVMATATKTTAAVTAARPTNATGTATATAARPVTATATAPATKAVAFAQPTSQAVGSPARPAVATAAPAGVAAARATPAGPMCPTDSSVASERARHQEESPIDDARQDRRDEPVRAKPVRGEASAPGDASAPGEAPAALEPSGSEEPWVPPNWKGPTGRGARSRARPASAPHASADPSAELSRMRASFEDVCKERDVLKAHIAKMEALIHDRVGAQVRSATPRTTSSAPTTPKGSRAQLGDDARSGSAARERLSKKAEEEMVSRPHDFSPWFLDVAAGSAWA